MLAVAAVDAGRGYKEAGNKTYKAGDYSGAIFEYHEALAAMRVAAGAPAEEEGQETYASIQVRKEEPWLRQGGKVLREEYSKIRSNTGECHLKLGAFERAVSECTKALAADESNIKAWYRRAKGWIGISKREDGLAFGAPQKARDDLCSALRLDGDNAAALTELKLVRQLCKAHVRLVPQEIVIDEENGTVTLNFSNLDPLASYTVRSSTTGFSSFAEETASTFTPAGTTASWQDPAGYNAAGRKLYHLSWSIPAAPP